MYTGPKLTNDNLVFGYDTGYGIADNNTATRFYPGAPTTNLNTDPYHSTKSAGDTVSLSTWGGDTGQGSFEVNTSPDGVGMMFVNHNTSNPAGTGGAYYDFPSTRYTLTNGVTYTRSWWCKADRVLSSVSAHICSCNRDSDNTYIIGSNISLNQNWQRFSSTFTYTGPTSTDWQFRHINYNTSKIYIANVQLEVNDFASPSVDGTRSNTTSLIDLKRTKDITVANVSFDSTGQPTFDGTDDHIALGASSQFNIERNVTIESVVKKDSSGWNGIFGRSDGGSFIHYQLYNGTVNLYFYGPALACVSGNVITSTSKYYHIVATFDGSSAKIYVDGSNTTTATTSSTANVSAADNVSVGKVYSSSRHFDGEIPVLKVYNRTLTSNEILKNYNAYKNRFNI